MDRYVYRMGGGRFKYQRGGGEAGGYGRAKRGARRGHRAMGQSKELGMGMSKSLFNVNVNVIDSSCILSMRQWPR